MLVFVIVASVCLALVVVAGYYLFVVPIRLAAYYSSIGVPGTKFHPFLGDIVELRKLRGKPNSLELMVAFSSARGRVSYGFIGPQLRLRLFEPDLVREVLVTHAASFEKPELMKRVLRPVLGSTSSLLTEGDLHRHHRLAVSPAFHFERLQNMVPQMASAARSAIDRWLSLPSCEDAGGGAAHKFLDMHRELSAVTLSIIGDAAFGASAIGGGAQEASATYDSIKAVLSETIEGIFSLRAFVPVLGELFPGRATATESRRLRSHLESMLERRRELRATMSSSGGPALPHILVDCLLDAHNSATPGSIDLSNTEILDEAITFVMAGHETVSQALSWTMYLLARNPEACTAARAEVLALLGETREPTYEDTTALPYTSAVIYEALRLFPPATLVVRTATCDVVLETRSTGAHWKKPLAVRRGTTIMVPIATMHRDPELWPDPHEFRPERFLQGIGPALRHPLAFLPFSAGPRNCIGQQFAMLEARVVLAILLQRLEWELDPTYQHSPEQTITLRPRYGMPMRVWARSAAPVSQEDGNLRNC